MNNGQSPRRLTIFRYSSNGPVEGKKPIFEYSYGPSRKIILFWDFVSLVALIFAIVWILNIIF